MWESDCESDEECIIESAIIENQKDRFDTDGDTIVLDKQNKKKRNKGSSSFSGNFQSDEEDEMEDDDEDDEDGLFGEDDEEDDITNPNGPGVILSMLGITDVGSDSDEDIDEDEDTSDMSGGSGHKEGRKSKKQKKKKETQGSSCEHKTSKKSLNKLPSDFSYILEGGNSSYNIEDNPLNKIVPLEGETNVIDVMTKYLDVIFATNVSKKIPENLEEARDIISRWDEERTSNYESEHTQRDLLDLLPAHKTTGCYVPDKICTQCNKKTIWEKYEQKRSADEPERWFFYCVSCAIETVCETVMQ